MCRMIALLFDHPMEFPVWSIYLPDPGCHPAKCSYTSPCWSSCIYVWSWYRGYVAKDCSFIRSSHLISCLIYLFNKSRLSSSKIFLYIALLLGQHIYLIVVSGICAEVLLFYSIFSWNFPIHNPVVRPACMSDPIKGEYTEVLWFSSIFTWHFLYHLSLNQIEKSVGISQYITLLFGLPISRILLSGGFAESFYAFSWFTCI